MIAGHKKKMITFYLVVVFFIFADRWLKWLASHGAPDKKILLIKNFLSFSLSKNENIAFSIPLSGPALEMAILILLAAILILVITKSRELGQKTAFFILILVGGASNLYDRLSYGYVVDYFNLSFFAIFNLADAMVTFGVLGLFFTGFRPNKGENPINQ
ncbi:MAG: signal peptidase II [Patescibacteria group bacterium]|jgi:signal peptidase II